MLLSRDLTTPCVVLALLALGCSTPPPCSSCGGVCVDLQSDTANCGVCGQACDAGMRCDQGRCATTCSGLMCGGSCVDAMNDPGNCGACGLVCGALHAQGICVAGQCGHAACEPGWSDCDSDPKNGCETLGPLCVIDVCGTTPFGGQPDCNFMGISDDGQRVLFTSTTPFFPEDVGFGADLFLFEVPTQTLEWLTRPGDAGVMAQQITAAALSGDGTRVAFTVYGDLLPPDNNGQPDLYLLDLTTGLLSLAPRPQDAGSIGAPQLIASSRTGRYLASYVFGGDVQSAVVWSDLLTGTSMLVPNTSDVVAISGDGLTVGTAVQIDQSIVPAVFDPRDGGLRALVSPDAGILSSGSASLMAFDYAGERLAASFVQNQFFGSVLVANLRGPLPVGDAGTVFPGAVLPSLSSDGRLMAVTEPDMMGQGAFRCSVIDLTTGERLPLPYQPGFCIPALSGDGRTLVLNQTQMGSLVLVRVNRP